MTATGLNQVFIATPGENYLGSSPRKDAPNPQQGMSDPAASVSANTAATATNTACTSPLTISSLEAAAARGESAAAAATASGNNGGRVPEVVSQVVASDPLPVEALLSGPMAKLALNHASPSLVAPTPLMPSSAEEKKMRFHRTPPTEHDNRKLFVGGLPTDVTDTEFLDFFKGFGDVIDSVVMVDRLTKRSRGFGFVTFASEKDAISLLTVIPGKKGYVLINGKQCEVKASTPKMDDNSYKHGGHHGSIGMWRSNHPRHDNYREYSSRHPTNTSHMGPIKHTVHNHQHRDEKHIYIDSQNQDVDGRNFDELYTQQPQINASYQPAGVYGRSSLTMSSPSMYHPSYQNVYSATATSGYAYSGSSSGAAPVPSSWEASYPAPSQGYGQYAPNTTMSGNNGYYDSYAAQYSSQYSNQYGNNSLHTSMVMGQTQYANYNSYYTGGETSGHSQGISASDGGFEPYPQSYQGDEDYDDVVDQCE